MNFDDVKNLLREGLRDEADHVAELQADLQQFGQIETNFNSNTNPARQTVIQLEGDKAFTIVEFQSANTEKPDEIQRKQSQNQDSIQQNVEIPMNRAEIWNDSTSVVVLDLNNAEQLKNMVPLNQDKASEQNGTIEAIQSKLNGNDLNELTSMIQYLTVKLEVDIGGRLNELDNPSWTNLEIKLQAAKKTLLAVILCRWVFIICTTYYSLIALGSFSQPISRIVVSYFLKNLIVMYFQNQLNKLLITRINNYHNFKDQLLKQKRKMEKFINKLKDLVSDCTKGGSEKEQEDQLLEKEEKNNEDKINIPETKDQSTNGIPDKNFAQEKCEIEIELNDNNKEQQILQKLIDCNSNQEKKIDSLEYTLEDKDTNAIQNIEVSPIQNCKDDLNEDNVENFDTQDIVPSKLIPAGPLFQIQQISQQSQSPLQDQVQKLKLKMNKLIAKINDLCNGELNRNVVEFKRRFDSQDFSNIDVVTKIRGALLASQPQLTLLSYLLKLLALIMTVSACTIIFKDIPQNIPSSFVLIIWLNIVQDNLQIFAFAALITIVFSFVILSFVFSRARRYIAKKLHERRFNQRCKSLPTQVYKINNNSSSNETANGINEMKECSICLSEYLEGETLTQLPCDPKHCFHQDCILTWIKVRNDCPLCRKSIF